MLSGLFLFHQKSLCFSCCIKSLFQHHSSPVKGQFYGSLTSKEERDGSSILIGCSLFPGHVIDSLTFLLVGLVFSPERMKTFSAKTMQKRQMSSLKVNQPTKRAADYWPYLRTTETVCQEAHPLHHNMRQSDTIGGGNIGIIMQILVLNFFSLHEQVPHGPQFHPISCILNQNLQNLTPRSQENFVQLACSRLSKLAHYTDKCPVKF